MSAAATAASEATEGSQTKAVTKSKTKVSNTLDFSFSNLTCWEDIDDEEPRAGVCKQVRSTKPSIDITTLKFNNNVITTLAPMQAVLERTLWDLSVVTMVDLSFNGLESIGDEFTCLPHLGILYLHGNEVSKLKEVKRLGKLDNLKVLSLHGNNIEKEEGYRNFVIMSIPTLRKLDFTTITKADQQRASLWKQVHAPKKLVGKRPTP
eukprot:m.98943 g.98943  ORF g.98943 m.98943 type:complete len:207 (-) comp13132_c0_seq3:160-780(-)